MKLRRMLLAVPAAAACLAVPVPAGASAAEAICGASDGPTVEQAAATPARGTLQLALVNSQRPPAAGVTVNFGDRRTPRPFLFEYTVKDCAFPESAVGQPLSVEWVPGTDAQGEQLESELTVTSEIKKRDLVVVKLTIDPADETSRPGTYTTGFVVVDDRVNLYREPVTATVAYDGTILFILTCLIPILAVGTILVWWKGRAAGSTESYGQWFKKVGNLLAVGAGAVAVVVYLQKIPIDQAGFGASLYETKWPGWWFESEFLTAVLGAFGAFTTTVLGSSLLADLKRGGTNPTADSPAGKVASR